MRRTRRTRRSAPLLGRAVCVESLEPRRLLATFALVGDFTQSQQASDVSNRIRGWNPDHIITLGDNYYDFISPYVGDFGAGSSSGNRFWPIPGNHDWDNSANLAEYRSYFTLPG